MRGYARSLWHALHESEAPARYRNIEGGSVEQHVDRRLQLHHCLNYAAALTLLDGSGEELHLLEAGCGSGALSHAFARMMPPGWRLTATDYDRELVESALACHRNPRLRFRRLNLLSGNLKSLVGDRRPPPGAVLLMEVIEHFEPGQAAELVGAFHAALPSGGRLLLTTLDRSPFPRRFSGYYPHRFEYDRVAMQRFLADPGRNPFRRYRLFRLVSSRIAGESVRAENRGGYLANRLAGLAQEMARRSGTFERGLNGVLTVGSRAGTFLGRQRRRRFELDAYLRTVSLCEDPAGEQDRAAFGLVAVLTR